MISLGLAVVWLIVGLVVVVYPLLRPPVGEARVAWPVVAACAFLVVYNLVRWWASRPRRPDERGNGRNGG